MSLQKIAPLVILALAFITIGFLFLGESTYHQVSNLRGNLVQQREINNTLGDKVDKLKSEIYGIKNDRRALEKAARNELGMARPGEIIYLFDKKDNTTEQIQAKKHSQSNSQENNQAKGDK